jgi:hypothetical protein
VSRPIFCPLTSGMSPTDNAKALQAAFNLTLGETKEVEIPSGTHVVDVAAHPNPNSFGTVTAAFHDKLHLRAAGAGKTEIKLMDSSNGLQDGNNPPLNRFFANWDMNATDSVEKDIQIEGITLNGNAAGNASRTNAGMHGIQLWNASRSQIRDVHIKNMLGWNTSTLETFGLDVVRCPDSSYENVRVYCDDGGATASGISINKSDRAWIRASSVYGMTNGQGFTYYSSASLMTSDCYAGGNASAGFNIEQSADFVYSNCISGAPTTWIDSGSVSAAFTSGASNANDKGFVVLMSHGGGRGTYVNCHAIGNTTRGFGITGSTQSAATTGTGTTAVVLNTPVAFPNMIGNYIQVGANPWVKITAVADTTHLTTDINHGGSSGDTVFIQPGQITWIGGTISGNGKGIQTTDGTTALKQLTARRMDFTTAKIYDNTTDLEDIGNGSSTSITRATGLLPAGTYDSMATATEFYNPFPFDVMVTNASASGVTSLRGQHPKDTAQSTAINSGTFILKAGGAITVNNGTMTNVKLWRV